MTEKIKCTLDDILKSKRKTKPIIVSFEHGNLEPKHTSKLKCGVYHDNLGKMVVAVETPDTLLYQGTEDQNQLSRTLIALRNKTTNKVRLLEACTIQLSPVLEQTKFPEIAEASKSSISNLRRSFGSKRSIRQSDHYERTRTNVEVISKQLSKAIENIGGEIDMSLYKPATEEYPFLPPRNCEAVSANLVYELDNILTSSELKELKQEAHNLLQCPQNYDSDENSILFSTLVHQVIPGKKTKLIGALLYMECILRLVKCDRRNLQTSLYNICPFSKLINDNIRETFTQKDGSKRVLSKTSKDKAVCYMIVLGLLITDFEFDISLIPHSIQLDQERLQKLSRIVGVTRLKRDSNFVTLKLPLPIINPVHIGKSYSAMKRRMQR